MGDDLMGRSPLHEAALVGNAGFFFLTSVLWVSFYTRTSLSQVALYRCGSIYIYIYIYGFLFICARLFPRLLCVDVGLFLRSCSCMGLSLLAIQVFFRVCGSLFIYIGFFWRSFCIHVYVGLF